MLTPSCATRDLLLLVRIPARLPLILRRIRETADAVIAAGLGDDLRVDADELAFGIHQRAAGVALVNRSIGLQEILVAPAAGPGGSALGADDPHRHRLANTERIADRQHNVTNLDALGIAERDRMEVRRVDLDHGQIARLVCAHHLRRQRAAVVHLDADAVRALDDVVVGEDVAVGADDDAGTERALPEAPRLARAVRLIFRFAEEPAEEIVVRR